MNHPNGGAPSFDFRLEPAEPAVLDAQNRRTYVAGVEERARHLEETREEEARRRVVEERLRIARDLHDSVAHSLASISVQAGAGAHVAQRRPDDAVTALLAIRQASQDALFELRATLGVLRPARTPPAARCRSRPGSRP